MILLDTNVVSEPMRPAPETRVVEWIDARPLETPYFSAITAEVREKMRRMGRVIAAVDGYIAAIAATHGFAVATRDTAPFAASGLQVIDPWSS
jgi:toxin FitB